MICVISTQTSDLLKGENGQEIFKSVIDKHHMK